MNASSLDRTELSHNVRAYFTGELDEISLRARTNIFPVLHKLLGCLCGVGLPPTTRFRMRPLLASELMRMAFLLLSTALTRGFEPKLSNLKLRILYQKNIDVSFLCFIIHNQAHSQPHFNRLGTLFNAHVITSWGFLFWLLHQFLFCHSRRHKERGKRMKGTCEERRN